MSRPVVLSISSQVAYGHVGNSVAVISLQTQGCTVIDIPTIILSSHPGHGTCAHIEIPASKINQIIDVLGAEGRLNKVDAVISGYITSVPQVHSIARAVELVKAKNPAAIYCCDPVIGDDLSGVYVPHDVAEAIKSDLIPICDILTPNLFEFQFITGQQPTASADCIIQARKFFDAHVLITSAPREDRAQCGNLLISPDGVWTGVTTHLDKVPNGTGDLITALFVAHYLSTRCYQSALSNACGQLNSVLVKTAEDGGDELSLSPLISADHSV